MSENKRLSICMVSKTEYIIPLTKSEYNEAWAKLIVSKNDSLITIGDVVFNRRNIETFREKQEE